MRMLAVLAVLIAQASPVHADCKQNPLMRRLSAITRLCVIVAQSQRVTANACLYDCLISEETIPKPNGGACPVTVKQRLFSDHTREIVAN
jgi:hypothetical protein